MKCRYCEVNNLSYQDLKIHEKEMHGKEDKIMIFHGKRCPHCGKILRRKRG